MATTFTGYVESKIIDGALMSLKNALIPLGAVTSKWDLTGKRYADSVLVPLYTGGTPASRTLGSAGSATGTVTVKTITLPYPTAVQWDAIDGIAGPAEFEKLAMEQAKMLAAAILAVPFAAVTKAAFGDTNDDKLIKSVADFGLLSIGDIGALARTKKMNNVKLVLNGAYYWRLFTSVNPAMQDKETWQSGKLLPQGGFPVYEYADLASNSENLMGVAIDPTSLLVGLAPVAPNVEAGNGDLIASEIVTDEESTIAFTYKRWYQSDAGKMVGRMEVMCDAAVGNNGIVRIVSA
jgi:hypothetical protein